MKNYQFINGPQIQADYFGQRSVFYPRITRIKRIIISLLIRTDLFTIISVISG